MSKRISLLGALAALALLPPPVQAHGDNILLILADDLGVDMVGCYGLGADLAPTPSIDALAASGVRFTNVWANPMCSPTRATVLTGRYSFRTQIGTIVSAEGPALDTAEWTLPRMLDHLSPHGYHHAAFGKWHLGHNHMPATHPNEVGFGHFAGTRENFLAPHDFHDWIKVVNGVSTPTTSYATSENVDDALSWIGSSPEPWFCYLSFNAPHNPWHAPPPHLHTQDLPDVDPRAEPRLFYKAAVEAMDTEIGRLLAEMDPALLARTTVIFLGDNGTPREVTVPPFDPLKAKLTVYEGGLRVPMIVSGPAVLAPGRACSALVNTTDLFATVLELAGVRDLSQHPVALDSVSFVPHLSHPRCDPLRDFVFAEIFHPNGPGPYTFQTRAIRDEHFKLIRLGCDDSRDELYDLLNDPFEQRDLLAPRNVGASLTSLPRGRYEELSARLDGILSSPP